LHSCISAGTCLPSRCLVVNYSYFQGSCHSMYRERQCWVSHLKSISKPISCCLRVIIPDSGIAVCQRIGGTCCLRNVSGHLQIYRMS
jgi:hypothetical protein